MQRAVLAVVAAIAMWMAHNGQRLAAASEALETRMDPWRERWGLTADEVYAPFWGAGAAED